MINKKPAVVIFFVAFILSGFISYSIFGQGKAVAFLPQTKYKPPTDASKTEEAKTEEKTEECPLNGELFGRSDRQKWEKRRPLGIMVENSIAARPQSGLTSADVIYEAVAEGGITRFLAIFYCQDAAYVGPVRSGRIYFIQLLQE